MSEIDHLAKIENAQKLNNRRTAELPFAGWCRGLVAIAIGFSFVVCPEPGCDVLDLAQIGQK